MAHTKAGGSTQLGRDSKSKRLGVKKYGGQVVIPGNIILRQRGTNVRPGVGTRRGEDDTIYAIVAGVVKFSRRKLQRFTGKLKTVKTVSVVPADTEAKAS
jgi:large subunit ribosomal protein L27